MRPRRLRDLLAVALGGVLGTAGRTALLAWCGTGTGLLAANLVGAFALGALAAGAHGSAPLGTTASLLLGTGLCGALTSFSALVMPVVASDTPPAAYLLVAAQLAAGVLAAGCGAACARRLASVTGSRR